MERVSPAAPAVATGDTPPATPHFSRVAGGDEKGGVGLGVAPLRGRWRRPDDRRGNSATPRGVAIIPPTAPKPASPRHRRARRSPAALLPMVSPLASVIVA